MEIGIWGDSITYGAGDKERLGWVGRLRNFFELVDDDTEVYNRGVCGNTSTDILKRFMVEAESIEPKKIIIALGANDAKIPQNENSNKVSIEEFRENIIELIKQARNFTDKIYVVGITSVNESVLKTKARFSNQFINEYNSVLKEICLNENIIFIDVSKILDINTDFSDGLHPNAGGYQKMFEVINEFIN